MSNVYKQLGLPAEKSEIRVIDYNKIISEKLERIKLELEKDSSEFQEDGFTVGLNAENVEILLDDKQEPAITEEEAKNTAEEILQSAREEAERIRSVAENDAAAIVKQAEEERIQILQDSSQEGREQGYQEGTEKARIEYEAQKEELNRQREEMELELKKQQEEMEPKLVETILEVLSSVTHLMAENKKDLILTIVNSALEGIDVSKNYIIRVCHEDAVFLRNNRDKLNTGETDAEFEIVEDPAMKKNQCIIDTELGFIDCGLDLQLEELSEDIRLLSLAGKRV